MRVSQSQLPYQIIIGLVEAMDPRGTHDIIARTSGGRVHARARTCTDDIGIGDEVVMLRLAGQIEWIILGRILNQYNAESTEGATLAPPLNFTVTGFRGFFTAQWDAVPDTERVAWQVEEAADDGGSPAATHTEAIVTQGSYYVYLCTTTNATVRHFRVRSIRYISANNLQYSAWSDWTSSTSLVWDDRYYTETEIGAVAAPSGASLVGVEDAGTYFTGTDVEAALQELGAGTAIAELHDITHINFKAATELTISNGEITVTQAYHTVDTEGDAADDLLTTINGGEEGEFLIIRPAHTDRTIVVDHGADNIFLWGQADVSLNDITDCFLLYHDGASWLDLGGQGTGSGGVTDHGALTGLGDDDHTIYLLANGSRNLAGNLGVDAAVTIDGVDISVHAANVNAHHAQSHKDLHDPEDGGDPLDCAAAVATSTANAEGSAHSFARSDHVHALHDHDHTGDAGDGAQVSHDTALTGVSADDHHAEDHKDRHDPEDGADPLDTAVPVETNTANAEGNAHELARANHVHKLGDHGHEWGIAGDGGTLDWDLIWDDAVHSHETDAEGGILIANGVTKTVKAAGGDFTTIQDAIDWFKGKIILGACKIDADAAAYDEAVDFSGLLVTPGATLELEGDTRILAGLSYVDGAALNLAALANGGSGTCGITRGGVGNVDLTITGTGGNPDYDADGWASGDKVLVFDNAGTITTVTLTGATNNVLTQVGAWPAIGDDGTAICLVPDRSIERTAAGQCVYADMTRGIVLDGWYLDTAAGGSCNGVEIRRGGQVTLENIAIQAEDYGLNAYGQYSVIAAGTGAVSVWNCARGMQAYSVAHIDAAYAIAVECTYGFYAANFSQILAPYAIATDCGTGFYANAFSMVAATLGTARQCTTGYQAAYGSQMMAASTDANNNGNGADYTPTPGVIPGNAQSTDYGALYAS